MKLKNIFLLFLVIVLANCIAQPQALIPSLPFTTANPGSLVSDSSPSNNTVSAQSDGWIVNVLSSGYARLSYRMPETEGRVYTSFYMRSTVVLPANFYTATRNGFRIMTTDNFTVNGMGAKDANELRCGVFIWKSDNLLHLRCEHETISAMELWKSTTPLPIGEHVLEFYGDLSKAALWYLKIDGVVAASGFSKLCLPDNLQSECVATRLRFGMDGAAGGNVNMSLKIRSIFISDQDINGVSTPIPTVSQTPSFSTATPSTTATPVATWTQMIPSAVATMTAECQRFSKSLICVWATP